MHALIVGTHGVGKSTLIRRVLKELNRPLSGYETQKEECLEDKENGIPIYIYDAGTEHVPLKENLLGYSKNQHAISMIESFDRYAPKLLKPVPENGLIELDEIGFMEAKSEPFCDAIMTLLNGTTPVIAAVKDKDVPFLNTVRSHPNARCFYITVQNREALFEEVLNFIKQQL